MDFQPTVRQVDMNHGIIPWIQSIGRVHAGDEIAQTILRKNMEVLGILVAPLIAMNSIHDSNSLTSRHLQQQGDSFRKSLLKAKEKPSVYNTVNAIIHAGVHALYAIAPLPITLVKDAIGP